MKKLILLLLLISFSSSDASVAANKQVSFVVDAWADNWFSLYANGKLIRTDSVPITTTKSFNKETFTFTATYPLTIAVIAKDYVENKSGLEYIGQENQQIGDGGFKLQIHEKISGNLVGVTSKKWKELTLNVAPLNTSCEKSLQPLLDCKYRDTSTPKNWFTSTFTDKTWGYATEFSEAEVSPKEGYFDVSWDISSNLIWGSNLKTHNTILLRKVFTQATSSKFTLSIPNSSDNKFPLESTCDGAGSLPNLTWSNVPSMAKSLMLTLETIPGPPREGEAPAALHYLLIAYNLNPASNTMKSFSYGLNFQNRSSFAPPCSQGPGEKQYTFTLYALKNSYTSTELLSATNMNSYLATNLLEKTSISLIHSRN